MILFAMPRVTIAFKSIRPTLWTRALHKTIPWFKVENYSQIFFQQLRQPYIANKTYLTTRKKITGIFWKLS
jgi:hypothetical protein